MSGAQKAAAVELEAAEVERGTSMTRNFGAFRANVASLMKQIAVSHRPMEVSDEV